MQAMPSPFVTRIAPTPSGFLHFGNLFSFYLTYLLAKENKGKIYLRIDDLFPERFRHQYLKNIIDTLTSWDFLHFDGPKSTEEFYSNFAINKRMPHYYAAFEKLYNLDLIYACKCSRKSLLTQPCFCRSHKTPPIYTPNVHWRWRNEMDQIATVDAVFGETTIKTDQNLFSIWRSNGLPSSHLASVVDDYHMGITAIVRGADLLGASAFQQFVASALDFNFPAWLYHHPLITNNNDEKLSKSAGKNLIALTDTEQQKKIIKITDLEFCLNGKMGNLLDINSFTIEQLPNFKEKVVCLQK